MAHRNRKSPGTTGFVATLVLTCTFFALATVIWHSDGQGPTVMAAQNGPAGSVVKVEVSPVSTPAAIH